MRDYISKLCKRKVSYVQNKISAASKFFLMCWLTIPSTHVKTYHQTKTEVKNKLLHM